MTRRLKVLHVGKFYPPHAGGMESHLALLCRELRREVDVEVVVSNDGPRTVAEAVEGVRVTRIGTPLTFASASLSPGMARAIRAAATAARWWSPTTATSSASASSAPSSIRC